MKYCPLCGTEATIYDRVCINEDCKRPFSNSPQKAAARRTETESRPATSAKCKPLDSSNWGYGILAIFFALVVLSIPILATEEEFLGTRVRRGGILKLIEQAIGWELFLALMVMFALLVGAWGIVHIWKAVNTTPDATALADRMEFHPAVRRTAVTYDEIAKWTVEYSNGNSILWLHFHKPYWSLQGLFRRKTVKLEGSREEIQPLDDFLSTHPVMRYKFVPK